MTDIPAWFVNWFNSSLGAGTTAQTGALADPSVTLAADKTSASSGETVTFTVGTANAGPGIASALAIGIPLGSSLSFVSSTTASGSYNPATGVWTIGDLPNAGSASLTITATVTGQGWDSITAQVVADGALDANTANNSAVVGIALPPPAPPGQQSNVVLSTDGQNVAPAVAGRYNVEAVTNPVANGIMTLQAGYSALIASGTAAATLVSNTSGGAIINGNAGNDVLISLGVNDTLQAGAGNNMLVSFTTQAFLSANGQAGNNSFFGGSGAVTVQAGAGHDTAVLGSGGGTVNTGAGGSQVWAGSGDTMVNGVGAATVVGGTGASTVNAVGDAGILAFGGSGKMQFNGGSGAATVVGLAGSVTVGGGTGGGLFFGGTAGNNVMNSGSGAAIMVGGGSGDLLTATGSANDVLVASTGTETLDGSTASGNNVFFGGNGSDCIVGGSGNDAIVAGPGNMTLTGGAGTNLFIFNAGATSTTLITDFDASRDFIYVAGFDTASVSASVAHAVVTAGSSTMILSDNTQITFAGVTNLSRSSFVP